MRCGGKRGKGEGTGKWGVENGRFLLARPSQTPAPAGRKEGMERFNRGLWILMVQRKDLNHHSMYV
jgi:hypothetical protein